MSQKEKIRDGTTVKPKAAVLSIAEVPDHLSDILLVMNMDKKSIRVASDETGKTDRLDKLKKEENPPFLKISGSNMVENFVTNYLNQSKDPTHFRFFRVSLLKAKEVASNIREIFKEKPSPEMQDFILQYEIKPLELSKKSPESQLSQTQPSNINNSNNLKIKEMATSQNQTATATAETASQPRFNEAMINWEQLKQFGISRDYLKEKGMLDTMLKGYKTNQLVPVRCNFGSAVLKTDARLSLQQSNHGVVLAIHGKDVHTREQLFTTTHTGRRDTQE